MITVDRIPVTAAINHPEADFEDAVVIAAAEAASVDAIITRDAAGFKDSTIGGHVTGMTLREGSKRQTATEKRTLPDDPRYRELNVARNKVMRHDEDS
ncbi:MAG: hypothetical protein R3B91_10250 [Planctomycetaceae bacterium]